MDRFDEEAQEVIAEIMGDCAEAAGPKIAAWGRNLVEDRDKRIAELDRVLQSYKRVVVASMSLRRCERALCDAAIDRTKYPQASKEFSEAQREFRESVRGMEEAAPSPHPAREER